jgi:hypothetical protein
MGIFMSLPANGRACDEVLTMSTLDCRHLRARFNGLMSFFVCLLMHRREREILVNGILPWGIDAVVFCWRCDRMRGRAVKVLQLSHSRLRA